MDFSKVAENPTVYSRSVYRNNVSSVNGVWPGGGGGGEGRPGSPSPPIEGGKVNNLGIKMIWYGAYVCAPGGEGGLVAWVGGGGGGRGMGGRARAAAGRK
jgi:hypothetical protein